MASQAAGLVACGAAAWLAWEGRRVRSELAQADWELTLLQDGMQRSTITANVGVIQFLPSRFSVTLDEVTQENGGVTIAGRVGNPFAMNVSSLTLDISVHRPAHTERDAWEKDPFMFLVRTPIARAQAYVGDVNAGGQSSFRMFIPNVQDIGAAAAELHVAFSSERYGYFR